MPTPQELDRPASLHLRAATACGRPGVCRVCHGSSGQYARAAGRATAPGSSSHTRSGSSCRSRSPAPTWTPSCTTSSATTSTPTYGAVRQRHRYHVAALLLRFLTDHRACIEAAAGQTFELIAVVPSKRGRAGAHPLEQAIELAPDLRAIHERLLDPGPGAIGRNTPKDDGFVARQQASGRRVLLIDDTFHERREGAVGRLGAGVSAAPPSVAGLVLGRVIDVASADYPERRAAVAAAVEDPLRLRRLLPGVAPGKGHKTAVSAQTWAHRRQSHRTSRATARPQPPEPCGLPGVAASCATVFTRRGSAVRSRHRPLRTAPVQSSARVPFQPTDAVTEREQTPFSR